MKLILPVHSGELFSYDTKNKLIYAERSTIEANSLRSQVHGPIYDDAYDTGFVLQSHKTGETVTFVFTNSHWDREGELFEDVYTPADEDLKRFPRLTGWRLFLFND